MSTFLVLIFLEAQTFCKDIDAPKVACMEAYTTCLLDDQKDYCAESFWHYYEGI